MKKVSKIVLTAISFLALTAAVLFTVFATDGYTGSVSELNTKIDALAAADDAEKLNLFDQVADYLATVDPAQDGYDAAVKRLNTLRIGYATVLLGRVDINEGTATSGVALSRVYAFLKYNPVSNITEEYDNFAKDYAAKLAEQDKAEAENLTKLSMKASFEEFYLDTVFEHDFQEGGVGKGTVNANKGTGGTSNFSGTKQGKDGDNSYYEVVYNALAHTYVYFTKLNGAGGVVVEFDYTTFDDLPLDKTVRNVVEHNSVTSHTGSTLKPVYLYIYGDGSVGIYGSNTVVENCVVKGGWNRFTLVINPDNGEFDFYLNYEFMGHGKSAKSGYNPATVRIGYQKTLSGGAGFAIDNLLIYNGRSVRDLHMLENMEKGDLFSYLVDYMINEEKAFEGRNLAYEEATKLLSTFWVDNGTEEGNYLTDREDVKAAVVKYRAFDYQAMKNHIMAVNLKGLQDIVGEIDGLTPTLNNTGDRETLLTKANNYVGDLVDMIAEQITDDQGNVRGLTYSQCINKISDLRYGIERDIAINNFINMVDRFERTISLRSRQKYVDYIKGYLNGEVSGFTTSVLGTPGYAAFDRAYEIAKIMDERVAAEIRISNSQKIIKCIEFISEYDTEQEWDENYDFVEKYVLMVRNLCYSGEYDASAEGLNNALEFYYVVNEYFYQKLQEEHIAYISGLLEKIASSTDYINRLGYCARITYYLAENDIDENNDEINALIEAHSTYLAEIKIQEENYANILDLNTVEFINIIDTAKTCSGYTEAKELYERAGVYYYAMNVGSDKAQAAIQAYNELGAMLKYKESCTNDFVTEVALLDLDDDHEDLFAQLAVCCQLLEGVDLEIEGANEAFAAYKQAYEAYTGDILAVNAELTKASSATLAVRDGFVSRDFLTVLQTFLSK